ncbi:hypothetical protein [Acetobacter cerevisiae]|uniref:hypothetical protein n=1 Tax=Acetobacter cerevisiae TaxID=178900 RepID=UPI00209E4DCC|nr:hypothetical protein [Acetobacter cerevisiae]MCP1270212.1 hypothetical protein [Acetobacter cerevisiae]MCP1278166.1 hypothetical protein [Acetobacter cerevisiae]
MTLFRFFLLSLWAVFISRQAAADDLPLLWGQARAGMSESQVLTAIPQARAEDVWQSDPVTHKKEYRHFVRFADRSDPDCPVMIVFDIGTGGLARVSVVLQHGGAACERKIAAGLVEKYGQPWHREKSDYTALEIWHKPDGSRVRLKTNTIQHVNFIILSVIYDMTINDDTQKDRDIRGIL